MSAPRLTVPQIARMRELANAGLSARAIARVIEVDHGHRPSEGTVRKYLGGMPHLRPVATLTKQTAGNLP